MLLNPVNLKHLPQPSDRKFPPPKAADKAAVP